MYKVYKHTCPNNKVYIGITCQSVDERWRKGNGYNHNTYFTAAIKKYGWNNIKHEILYTGLTKEEACQKEIELIAMYHSNDRKFGYNLSVGGESHDGCAHSEETKAKMRLNHADFNGFNNPMYGKHRFGVLNPHARSIRCVETGIVYSYIGEVCEKLHLDKSSVVKCCKGKRKTAGGFHWQYVESVVAV